MSETLWRGRALSRLAGCTLRRLAARPIKRLVVCPSSHAASATARGGYCAGWIGCCYWTTMLGRGRRRPASQAVR